MDKHGQTHRDTHMHARGHTRAPSQRERENSRDFPSNFLLRLCAVVCNLFTGNLSLLVSLSLFLIKLDHSIRELFPVLFRSFVHSFFFVRSFSSIQSFVLFFVRSFQRRGSARFLIASASILLLALPLPLPLPPFKHRFRFCFRTSDTSFLRVGGVRVLCFCLFYRHFQS